MILIALFFLMGGFGYGTYLYSTQSIHIVETAYQEEREFVEALNTRETYKNFLASYASQSEKGSERILPLEPQNANLFTHISTLGELYDVLTADFQISTPDSGSARTLSLHTKMTVITFDFVGSRYNVKEFLSRLEEVAPLITIREFSLALDTTQATKGSLAIETYRFDYNIDEKEPINTSIDPLDSVPDSLPAYNSLHDLKTPLTPEEPFQIEEE